MLPINRAGEITYTRIAPFTTMVGGIEVNYYKYRIMVITYTDDGKGIADRCIIPVIFGDGEQADAIRINGSQPIAATAPAVAVALANPYPVAKSSLMPYRPFLNTRLKRTFIWLTMFPRPRLLHYQVY